MKAIRSLIQFCRLGMLLALCNVTQAQLTFITNNGAITITGCAGNLPSITIPSTTNGFPVTGIGDGAFFTNNFTTLKNLTIPDSIITVGSRVCYRCIALTNVSLGGGLTNIGKQMFSSCGNLGNVLIPNSVVTIETNAFAGCTNMTSVVIPNSVTSIASGAFFRCTGLTNVTIGTNVNSIGSLAFAFCTNLTSLVIPDSVTNIGRDAFDLCTGLTNIALGNGVIGLGDAVFWSCLGLTNFTIPNQVTSIGNNAFWFCTNMSSISVGTGVTNIGTNAFYWCPNLTGLTVDSANLAYSSTNGILFDKNQTVLVQYPMSMSSSYNVPDGVTNIGVLAFSCNVTNVTLPTTMAIIDASAFNDCDILTSLYFRGNAPGLGSTNFNYVSNTIVYYLPAATGWGSTYAVFPTMLWLPKVQTGDASFGIQGNQFGFNLNWASGQTVIVEASTNLSLPDWQPLQTNALASDSIYFSDPQWADYPGRFYRLRSP